MTPEDSPATLDGDADRERLETALARATRAAREAGIEAGDPLGLWVAAVQDAVRQIAAMVDDGKSAMRATVAAAADAAKDDRARLQAATEHCRATTLKLESTFGTLQARADHLMTQAIASMGERVADKASKYMVIVERRHNRKVLWRTSATAAVLMLLMIALGWGLNAYSDWRAEALLSGCLTGAVQDRTSGEYYCPYGMVPPR